MYILEEKSRLLVCSLHDVGLLVCPSRVVWAGHWYAFEKIAQ